MAVPTSMDETDLAQYMVTMLGEVASSLGWSVTDPAIAEAVTETLIQYGVSTASEATLMGKLRAFARREAWRAAVQSLSARYDFSTDGQSFHRSQLVAQAKAMLNAAERGADAYGGSPIRVAKLDYGPNDPYSPVQDDLRHTL